MSNEDTSLTEIKEETKRAQKNKQKILLTGLTLVFVLIAVIYGLYWFLHGRFFVSTDDAYVNGNVVPVIAQITGNVTKIDIDDTEAVHKGQRLLQIDTTDNSIALQAAKAILAQTVRETAKLFIDEKRLRAAVKVQQIDLQKIRDDLKRRLHVIKAGGVSEEELTHVEDNFKIAEAALIQAKAAWQANQALINNTTVKTHPAVKKAAADVKQAYINYLRTSLRAPLNGYVAKRAAQVGQRVFPGSLLMAIVPLDQIWVDANFKEKQLTNIQVGQPVTLYADVYGSAVQYHGTIVGFSAGTGSAFSLLPAQNATGNWIKVVQRLPVRIIINPDELKAHPLRIGLSMEVTVDTEPKHLTKNIYKPVYQTNLFDNLAQQADQLIEKIIRDNLLLAEARTINDSH